MICPQQRGILRTSHKGAISLVSPHTVRTTTHWDDESSAILTKTTKSYRIKNKIDQQKLQKISLNNDNPRTESTHARKSQLYMDSPENFAAAANFLATKKQLLQHVALAARNFASAATEVSAAAKFSWLSIHSQLFFRAKYFIYIESHMFQVRNMQMCEICNNRFRHKIREWQRQKGRHTVEGCRD